MMKTTKEPQLIISPSDVEKELASLGISSDDLIEVGKRGLAARNNATENDPPGTGGFYAYSGITRAFRELYLPKRWEKLTKHNLPFTINTENKIAVVISSGDSNVGIEERAPRTKNPKGKQYQSVIYDNQDFFGIEEKTQKLIFPDFQTLVLLYCCDNKKGEMRLELSSPINMDTKGYVDEWYKRILLSPIPFDAEPTTKRKQTNLSFDNSQDFDIPVKRRNL